MLVAQRHGLPFQRMRERKIGLVVLAEGEDRLQIGQVIGAGVFAHHKQAVDVRVAQGLAVGVVLELREFISAVFGVDRFAVQLDAGAFQQQQ